MKREADGRAEAALAALAARHGLSGARQRRLGGFLALLAHDPEAPTAVRDPVEAVDVHLADSLAVLPHLEAALAGRRRDPVADLGSGAGLPGVPLAVARPQVRFDLVEATRRKCGFLSRVVAQLGLANVEVVCARAEEVPAAGMREAYGAVLARALAPLATLVEYAAPLLADGGHLLAWKGGRDRAEEQAGARASDQVGLEPVAVHPVTPYAGSRNRHLHLYRKVRPCPPRFPRRPGRARRSPLA